MPWWCGQPPQLPGSWHVHAHVSVTSFQRAVVVVVVIEVVVEDVSGVVVVLVAAVVALVVSEGFGYALLSAQ